MMLPEASLMAIAEIVKAVAKLVEVSMEGATPEQRAQMWQWYIDDMNRWRKLWGLEG